MFSGTPGISFNLLATSVSAPAGMFLTWSVPRTEFCDPANMVQEGTMEFALRKHKHYFCQNRRLRTLSLIPDSTVAFKQAQWKMQYLHIERKIQIISRVIFVISSHLVLVLERIKRRKHFMVKSIDFIALCRQNVPKHKFGLHLEKGAICSTYQTQNTLS